MQYTYSKLFKYTSIFYKLRAKIRNVDVCHPWHLLSHFDRSRTDTSCSLIISRIDYTAMLSCVVLQPAASRNLNVFKALLEGSFRRRQGGPTPDHYCVSSTGCRFDSGSQFSRSAARRHLSVPTSAVSLQRASVASLCASLQFRYC